MSMQSLTKLFRIIRATFRSAVVVSDIYCDDTGIHARLYRFAMEQWLVIVGLFLGGLKVLLNQALCSHCHTEISLGIDHESSYYECIDCGKEWPCDNVQQIG